MKYLIFYLAILVIAIVVYFFIYRHEKKMRVWLNQRVDRLLYQYNSVVYTNKDTIFDYKETKKLLFHNQKTFFAQPTHYIQLLPLLLKDIDFLSNLTKKEIIPEKEMKELNETEEIWEKIHNFKKYTHTILIILTLWIGKIFIPE